MIHWECVIPSLEAGVQEIWTSGKMSIGLAKGIIYLIPKAAERSLELRQWRPITILNMAYKILAKVLARVVSRLLTGHHTRQSNRVCQEQVYL